MASETIVEVIRKLVRACLSAPTYKNDNFDQVFNSMEAFTTIFDDATTTPTAVNRQYQTDAHINCRANSATMAGVQVLTSSLYVLSRWRLTYFVMLFDSSFAYVK